MAKNGSEAGQTRVTAEDITRGLAESGLPKGAVVLVHSSLSRFGYVEGRAKAVVDALVSRNLSASSLTVLAFSNTLTSYGKELFLPALTHTAKIADESPAPLPTRRTVVGCAW